jgi:hypothetical protein
MLAASWEPRSVERRPKTVSGGSQPTYLFPLTIIAAYLVFSLATTSPSWSAQANGSVFVFKVSDDISPEKLQAAAKCLERKLGVKVASGPLFASYRLIAVGPTHDILEQQTAKAELQKLLPEFRITSLPISSDGQGRTIIPTGLMIVEFKRDVSKKEASDKLISLKLKIVEGPSDRAAGRYVVKTADDNLEKLTEARRFLQQSRLVDSITMDVLTSLK